MELNGGGNGRQRDLFKPETRADQIFARFEKFHAANPQIWSHFRRFALEAVQSGRARFGGAMIIQRIRYFVEIETKGDVVKINNDFEPYYVRMFVAKFPQHEGLFELRRRTSADYDGFDVDLSVVDSGPLDDEAALLEKLRKM